MPTQMLDRRRLHYVDERTGDDDAVVLVHDFPLDSSMWQPQLHHLAPEHRVIAPDLAGCGDSDPPENLDEHSIDAWADDLVGLIAALGVERPTLVGAGVGADVALAVTRRDRDSVGALVLAGLRTAEITPDDERHLSELVHWVRSDGDLGPVVDRLVDDLAPEDSPFRSEIVKFARFATGRLSRDGWIAGLHALRTRPDPAPDLVKLDVPVVFVVGEHDPQAPSEEVRAMAARAPGAGVVELPGGHLPNYESPELFTRVIDDALQGRTARRAAGKHPWPASPAGTRTG